MFFGAVCYCVQRVAAREEAAVQRKRVREDEKLWLDEVMPKATGR